MAELNAVTKLESALETELRLAETVTVVEPVCPPSVTFTPDAIVTLEELVVIPAGGCPSTV